VKRRRAVAAGAILALWLGGLATLAFRQFDQGESARLERAALLVSPGAEYYGVFDGGRQVGFGSSTIDTSAAWVRITDFVVADLSTGRPRRRVAARTTARLTRGLRLTFFRYELGADAGPYTATGTVFGDTLLSLVVSAGHARPVTQRIRLHGPLFLPTMVPMVIALGDRAKVGEQYTYDVFDPVTGSSGPVTVRVNAESLFVVPDSAMFDTTAGRWVAAHEDTLRAWRLEQLGGGRLTGWIDSRGRMVSAEPLEHLAMHRTAYEMAYLNWTRGRRPRAGDLHRMTP